METYKCEHTKINYFGFPIGDPEIIEIDQHFPELVIERIITGPEDIREIIPISYIYRYKKSEQMRNVQEARSIFLKDYGLGGEFTQRSLITFANTLIEGKS